jgi:hypothetical protein
MADGYADDGLDWYRQLVAGGPNDPYGSAGNLPGSGVSGYPQASGRGPYMGYPAQGAPAAKSPGSGFSISQLLGINPANADELPPTGYQGAGHYDPITNTWTDTPGHSLNSMPQGGPPRVITTPSSAPTETAPPPTFKMATPQGGQLTPYSSGGAPAPGIRTYPFPTPRMPRPGLLNALPDTPSASETEARINNPPGLPTLRDIRNTFLGDPTTREILQPGGGITTEPMPQTQTQPKSAAAPPGQPPPPVDTASPPPINLPPFNVPPPPPQPPPRGVPIPPQPTFHTRGGKGSGGPANNAPQGALANPNAAAPSPGEYFATTGNARGASWTPGGFASPPAQHFQTPLTPTFGPGQWIGGGQPAPGPAAPQVVGRGAPQGGYNVGGMFANLPNNTFDNSGTGGGGRGGRTQIAPAQASMDPNSAAAMLRAFGRSRLPGNPGAGYAGP